MIRPKLVTEVGYPNEIYLATNPRRDGFGSWVYTLILVGLNSPNETRDYRLGANCSECLMDFLIPYDGEVTLKND